MKHFFICLILLCTFLSNGFAARYYVNAGSGSDTNTGTSWAKAFQTFQKAIEVANNNDEIWLAGGTYRPTKDFSGQTYPTAGIYGMGFYISKALQIYGRFDGTETNPDQRNPANAPTIFSGDFFGDDLANPAQQLSDLQGENTQRILYMTNLPANGKIRLDDVVITGSRFGGGLLIADGGSDITITDCRFTGNFNDYYGDDKVDGAAAFIGTSAVGCYPKIDHCTFDHNEYRNSPGACMIWGANGPAKATITNCIFENNSGEYSGALTLFGANGVCEANVSACSFLNNNQTANGYGGAVSSYNADLFCFGCTFDGNAANYGGAVGCSYTNGAKSVQLTNCSLTNNVAIRGGAIYTENSNVKVLGTLIDHNASTVYEGGAICITTDQYEIPTSFTCLGVEISNNTSAGNGGAIYDNDPFASIELVQTSIKGNTAQNGGAYYQSYTKNSAASKSFYACVVLENQAIAGNGGGFYLQQSAGTFHPEGLKIAYSTLHNNHCTAKGNQVFADHAVFEGRGLISWNTEAGSGDGEFAGANNAVLKASYSLIQSGDCASSGLTLCTANVFGQDPQFEDPINADFHLQKCSPAVNAGETTNQNFLDFEGKPAPYNDGTQRMDMGAFEYQGTVSGCVKAICKNIVVNLNAAGTVNVPAGSINNGSTGCAALDFKINDRASETFSCDRTGDQLVTLKVTDCQNNSAACVATVTVRDITAPATLCKAATLYLDAAGQASLTAAQVNNGSSDNCAVILSLNQTNFTCANTGNNSVTLSGTDPSGNKSSCNATVTIKDGIAPLVKCKNITANLGVDGSVTVAPVLVNNGSSDNCSLSMALTPNAFSCSNVGPNNVTLRATDASGNSSTCAAIITVKDVTAPKAICKNPTVVLDDLGHASLNVNQVNNGSSDACGIATMTLSKTQFNCSEIGGAQTITMTIKDVNNNQSSCLAQVTVKDNFAPTAVCENTTVQLAANGKVTVYPADLADNSFDNCSVTSFSPVAKVYTTANIGDNNLSITVKDWTGSAANCVSIVTVQPYNGMRNSGGDGEKDNETAVLETPAFRVFPNPTSAAATVELELTENQTIQLQVLDMTGRQVMQQQMEGLQGANQFRLDLGSMPVGIYLVELQMGDVRVQQRLMLQHN